MGHAKRLYLAGKCVILINEITRTTAGETEEFSNGGVQRNKDIGNAPSTDCECVEPRKTAAQKSKEATVCGILHLNGVIHPSMRRDDQASLRLLHKGMGTIALKIRGLPRENFRDQLLKLSVRQQSV